MTASAFFQHRIERQLARVRDGQLPGIIEKDCFDQLELLHKVLGQDVDNTLFALDHGNLKPNHIIFDENNNIKCIVGWGNAATAPVASAARLPGMLWSKESAHDIPSQETLQDRRDYVESYASQDAEAANLMRKWQNGKNVDFRTPYFESIASKGMLKSMASVGWALSYDVLTQ
ncbi:hypothetical protein VHEMI05965 [[Torrubiella] hemipterigena]|uniref:Aminoglycoside phosphotransferase domain-containing protein n=1 Tax=[Torrubiella] hemipterigena TaxID=1531966 RepID=A0A0A1T5W0_9HYPO|nr:hypothetical protein VHEMI05965 [[Torrubiella] hemipterigena]